MSEAQGYEIDHGEPAQTAAARAPATPAPAPAQDDGPMRAALAEAIATVTGSSALKGRIDLTALILAALCCPGLGAVTKVEEWGGGAVLSMLLTLAAVLGVVVAWRWCRAPAQELSHRPLPAQLPASIVTAHDAAERTRLQARNEADISAIALLASACDVRLLRLRRAVRGALGGFVVGVVVACSGWAAPSGTLCFTIGLAAAGAAAVAWVSAGQEWSRRRLHLVAALGVPGLALLVQLIAGGGFVPAIAAAIGAVVSGGLVWWRRDDLLTRLEAA